MSRSSQEPFEVRNGGEPIWNLWMFVSFAKTKNVSQEKLWSERETWRRTVTRESKIIGNSWNELKALAHNRAHNYLIEDTKKKRRRIKTINCFQISVLVVFSLFIKNYRK